MAEGVFTACIPPESSASLTPWPRCWTALNRVVRIVIDQYLDVQAWQIEQIRHGVEEADQGELVPRRGDTEAHAKIRKARDSQ